MSRSASLAAVLAVFSAAAPVLHGQTVTNDRKLPVSVPSQIFPKEPTASVPELRNLRTTTSELADVVERYSVDLQALSRRYDAPDSPAQRERMRVFYSAWRDRLRQVDFDRLSQDGRIDYVLLDNQLEYSLDLLARTDKQRKETAPLLPFVDRLLALHDARRDLRTMDAAAAARVVSGVAREIDSLRTALDAARNRDTSGVARTIANRAAERLDALKGTMASWNRFYAGYDPMFNYWVANPYQKLDEAMTRYAATIRTRIVGIPATQTAAQRGGGPPAAGAGAPAVNTNTGANSGPIIGDPVGAEALAADLKNAMIPYTPEELVVIAEREYAFSLAEAKKAAREMGFGDDWKKAMDKVKDTYVEPGKQPDLIRDLARQAEEFLDKHDWVTIPALAREDWRMEMMSPDRQRVNPFFLGGEMIQVSYPTADMTDDEKLMSLRGNNPHFSKAVVHHELNPGHHLQGFMSARYNPHRRLFSTPFWNEGQALYWEMFLYDRDFYATPEDRMGALFWRMHRSARIIFSLNFHLGKMTPNQAVQFLIDTVNFERANAEGEVRRSFNGTYSPLYQAAYMLGGLQMRAMYEEIVGGKKMSTREFHDAVLQGGPMPMAMVRARLLKLPMTREGAEPWKFGERIPKSRPFPVKGR